MKYKFLMILALSIGLMSFTPINNPNQVKVVVNNGEIDQNLYTYVSSVDAKAISVRSNASIEHIKNKALTELKKEAAKNDCTLIHNVQYQVKKENYGKKRKVTVSAKADGFRKKS